MPLALPQEMIDMTHGKLERAPDVRFTIETGEAGDT